MLMGIGVKRAAIAIAIVVAGAISFFVAATHMVPVDTMREAVKREIDALTGLTPVVRGPVSLPPCFRPRRLISTMWCSASRSRAQRISKSSSSPPISG